MDGFQFAIAVGCLTLFGFAVVAVNDYVAGSYPPKKRLITFVLGIIVFTIATLFLASEAYSHPQYCENIKDHDSRNMCKALTTGNIRFCENIWNKDLRNMCKARVSK